MRMFQQIYTNNKSVLVLSFVYDFVGTTLYAVNVNVKDLMMMMNCMAVSIATIP